MACISPLKIPNKHFSLFPNGYKNFSQKYYEVPCGYCLNCRVDKRNSIEDRCNYEWHKRQFACFVRLSYDDEHAVSLARNVNDRIVFSTRKKDVQDFFKRIRSYINYHQIDDPRCQKDFKVLWCTEYGDLKQRPHAHFIAFGLDFAHCHKMFQKLWKFGFIDCRPLQNGGIRYVCDYLDSQPMGTVAKVLYDEKGLERPVCKHSIGLGSGLFLDNLDFIMSHNMCYPTLNPAKCRPVPSYYKRRMLGQYERRPSQFQQTKTMKELKINHDVKEQDYLTPILGYSLKEINEFKKKRSVLRFESRILSNRNNGKPVSDDFLEELINSAYNPDYQTAHFYLSQESFNNLVLDCLDPIPF